ncbi:DUF222 domain-containing protein [Glycomyces sp. NPDC048151]|uniref:HNH endonuclease signature motif containing protein n=1 Tax=Glycomyces sp. NPDC048151 TaxID=3364002 RepID=UPI003721DD2A
MTYNSQRDNRITPEGVSRMNGTDRNSQAQALRPRIDNLTSQLCAVEANLLQAVIAYTSQGLHKECDGFSGIRDWIKESFNLNEACAGQIASIARLAPKFKHLTEAALAGAARIDAIAYAMRRIEREGLAVHARAPYPSPVESPYSPTLCNTSEELIREYCIHSTRSELAEHLDRICAELFDQQSLLDELSQQSLAWLEVNQRPDGMWDIEGLLTDDTGQLISNALKTAVPPPRQDEADADGLLPRVSGRNAEALHQMAAAYGTSPDAPRRHGHTATLNLTCDIETLRGDKTGRLAKLDGKTISVAKARLLACEAGVIPSVFDYSTGEAIELGRAKRLPNVALRHKLELEQPEGCAWQGCRAPISWTEAHHVVHWADGGATSAENLILLCRFHHSRIHLDTWSITKTGPGKASIRHIRTGATDAEWDADADLPSGQVSEEFSRGLKRQLDDYANWFAQKNMEASITRARTSLREEQAAEVKACRVVEPSTVAKPALVPVVLREDPGDPPFLSCPQRATAEGARSRPAQPDSQGGPGPSACPGSGTASKRGPARPGSHSPRPARHLPIAARLKGDRIGPRAGIRAPLLPCLVVAARLKQGPTGPGSRSPGPAPAYLFVAARLNRGPVGPRGRSPGLTPPLPLRR